MRNSVTGVLLLASLLVLAACSKSAAPVVPTTEPTAEEPGIANMANPASVYCEEQGGTVDIRTADDGSQAGYCVFDDGSECDEWAFYRGECAPAAGSSATPAASTIYMPNVVTLQAADYAGWQTYKNMTYGFSLSFPVDWIAAEVTDSGDTMVRHRVTLTSATEPLVALHIAFKAVSEDVRITATSMGAGDLVTRGSVPFLGEDLERQALVAEGKDVGIVYGGGGEVARGDLVFWISLGYAGNPTTDPGLSAEIEALADQIITSLQIEP